MENHNKINVVAILITFHNNENEVLKCLYHLYKSIENSNNIESNIYIVDDGSKNNITSIIKKRYPKVNLIQGNGSLYWNGGMTLAWKKAIGQYNYYIWLNSDTYINKNALNSILNDYKQIKNSHCKDGIITAACHDEYGKFTYGGRDKNEKPIIPNGKPSQCQYINGNFVLVPKTIKNDIGILSSEFTHQYGDIEYGLRAKKNGYECFTTSNYLAICKKDKSIPKWANSKIKLHDRIIDFHSPKGLHMTEYRVFRKMYWKSSWIIYVGKAYLKLFIPKLYSRMKYE